MRPLKNRVMIEERLDAVEYFSKSSNQEMVSVLHSYLNDVGSVKVRLLILIKFQGCEKIGHFKLL